MTLTTTEPIPPGLQNNLSYYTSGGEGDWLPLLPIKYYTNTYLIQHDKMLLGYKKRGFGQGKYNGFGGKVEPEETSAQAALRELEEEAGIKAPLQHAGVLLFINKGAETAFHIDIYLAEEYSGKITETDEMRPEWFSFTSRKSTEESIDSVQDLLPVPWDNMWDTDRFWLPLLRDKCPFIGRADFEQDEDEIYKPRKWWFGTLTTNLYTPS